MYDGYNFEVYCDRELCSKVITKDNKVYIERYILHPLKQIFYKDEMNIFELSQVLKLRCWDDNREDLKELLAAIGLFDNNPFEICRKTHGMMYQDHIWFKYEGEDIGYEDTIGRRLACRK